MYNDEFEKDPNPTKDQHFMVDKTMLERIYDTANILPGESICEIGGGVGALTDYLVQGNNMVTVIEKDPYYAKLLKEKYADYPNVKVYEAEASGIRMLREAGIDESVLRLKSIEALKDVADGNATKIFMPADISNIVTTAGVIGETLGIGKEAAPKKKAEEPMPDDPCCDDQK